MPMGGYRHPVPKPRREHLGVRSSRRGTDLRRTASEDEVAVVEIGYGDTLEDEDVGAMGEHHVMVDLHHVQVGQAVDPGQAPCIDPVVTVAEVSDRVRATVL